MFTPGGDLMSKVPVGMPDKRSCIRARDTLPKNGEDLMDVRFKGLCVTNDHWNGKNVMKNMPLD